MESKKTILYSFLLALLAMAVSYFCTNRDVALSGERDVLKYWSFVSFLFSSDSRNSVPEEVLFINTSSDLQLVDRTDENGFSVGNAAITDRRKLDDLLNMIKSSGNYKYVLLDVFFEDGYESDHDSSLFRTIASMDRIVIPRHTNGTLVDASLEQKAAYADYKTTLKEDNITKYPLLDNNGNYSIPLKMYSDLTGRTVRRMGPIYMDRAALSRRVVFPKMFVQIDSSRNTDGKKTYLNLGSDILDYREMLDLNDYFKDKIIVIGSLAGDDDIHLTYAGDNPGCVINYNVFTSLMRGQHKIPVGLILVYFLIFFAMSYLLLSGDSDNSQSWGWIWAKLFVIYSIVLTIVCIFVFMIWGQAHDIFITSTLFSIIDACHKKIAKKESHA